MFDYKIGEGMESIACLSVSLSRIQIKRFCLREDLNDSGLTESIRSLGLLQPLTVAAAEGKKFDLVSGHRRFHALKKLGKKNAPVFLISGSDANRLFLTALVLNHPASYLDLDRCKVLRKAVSEYQMPSAVVQKTLMPLIGLSPSPKVLNQYLTVAQLPDRVLGMIRQNRLPFLGSQGLAKLTRSDLEVLCRRVLLKIRPTASQLAHICEWMFDLIQTQKKSAAQILNTNAFFRKSGKKDARALTDEFYRELRALRFADLAAKEKAFEQAAKQIRGTVSGLEIRAPDHFEQEGFYVHAHIQNAKSLHATLRQLQDAQNQASALFDTLL